MKTDWRERQGCMPRVRATPTIVDVHHMIQDSIDKKAKQLSKNHLELFSWVLQILKHFPFVGDVFAVDLAGYVDTHKSELEKTNPEWRDGSLFETISYLPGKEDFTFRDEGLPVEHLIILCAAFSEGSFQHMESRDIKKLTGYSLRDISHLSDVVGDPQTGQ